MTGGAGAYRLRAGPPGAADFCRLRRIAGLSERTLEAAQIGLTNGFHGVHVTLDGVVVAMGRIIGDGGCCFQLCDIAVDPAHQGKGLGKQVMAALMAHLRATAPPGAYVSLIADGDARFLYEQFGFKATAPASIGMSLDI